MRCLPLLLAALVMLLPALPSSAATIVAPNALAGTEGGSNNCFPFTCTTSMRYQQGYDAAHFGVGGPLEIQAIAFRLDGPQGQDLQRVVELQINLSTSANEVGLLSTTFANNVGVDDTVAFAQQDIDLSATSGASPNGFDVAVVLETPFVYDPTAGDLLLDVRVFSATGILPLIGDAPLDATDGPLSELHRVYWDGDVSNGFGTSDPGFGLVTHFTFIPEPGSAVLLALGLAGLAARVRS